MTKKPGEPDDDQDSDGGRAAERLRDLMRGRLPADTSKPQNGAAPEERSESVEGGEEIHEQKDKD